MTPAEQRRRLALLRHRITEAVKRCDYRLAASLAQDAHWLAQQVASGGSQSVRTPPSVSQADR